MLCAKATNIMDQIELEYDSKERDRKGSTPTHRPALPSSWGHIQTLPVPSPKLHRPSIGEDTPFKQFRSMSTVEFPHTIDMTVVGGISSAPISHSYDYLMLRTHNCFNAMQLDSVCFHIILNYI